MAAIYDTITGDALTEGLQGCTVCGEAIQAASRAAAERNEDVLLDDDDGLWIVHPDGSAEIGELGADGVFVPSKSCAKCGEALVEPQLADGHAERCERCGDPA